MKKSFPLFPFDEVRPEQNSFMSDVQYAISSGKCLIAHAPTGLGKTAASLSPALEYALKNRLTVFFLTSRHTQHSIAIETLRRIRKKSGISFSVTDILGKKHMCAQPGIDALHSRQFHEYCKYLRESGMCQFYSNLKKGTELSTDARFVVDELKREPAETELAMQLGKKHTICPYEAAAIASKDSSVIIADYYYIFNSSIREGFLKKSGKSIEESIIVVDEGHNLPDRMREMLSEQISSFSVERALKEAEKFASEDEIEFLENLRKAISRLAEGKDRERIIEKNELSQFFGETNLKRLSQLADEIREIQKQSYIGGIVDFINAWKEGDDEGFSRILSIRPGFKSMATISYRCLDPGIESGSVFRTAKSVILMSGTLTPTSMYKEVLGFPEGTLEKSYKNPFPQSNRLSLIVTGTTTQFSKREPKQYEKIAGIIVGSINEIPGNAAVFFPSYDMLNEIYKFIHGNIGKMVFVEHPGISKEEKTKLLSDFKRSYLTGGLLLAVIGGSFYEGIDLPGDLLNGVIIVGLPLGQPDLETKKLIEYYDRKYSKGWDYGYVFPAFTKAMQSAGRCIRSETDRGVVIFVDDRYTWSRYYGCFPRDLNPKITVFYKDYIREFFKPSAKTLGQ